MIWICNCFYIFIIIIWVFYFNYINFFFILFILIFIPFSYSKSLTYILTIFIRTIVYIIIIIIIYNNIIFSAFIIIYLFKGIFWRNYFFIFISGKFTIFSFIFFLWYILLGKVYSFFVFFFVVIFIYYFFVFFFFFIIRYKWISIYIVCIKIGNESSFFR
jgi:hypothetical protein